MKRCKTCGEYNCTRHALSVGKAVTINQFSGSSPPEIFVGRWNYPNVYTGILAPQEYGDKQLFSSPEQWHAKKLPIEKIMQLRNELIYGRTQSNIKKVQTKFVSTMAEVAMTHKSVATEFKLKKAIRKQAHPDARVPLISKAAPVERVRLQENAPVKKKIDYLVNDDEVKSSKAILELHKANIPTSNIIKILSSGLLGLKKNRRLVPTRWSITATDDTISKNKLKTVKQHAEISEYHVFTAEYVGNHYEFLLLPDTYSFEVIEMRTNLSAKDTAKQSNCPKITSKVSAWQDHESFLPRKKYADSVTGAYYANRLALVEHLEKIKRQAACLVIREIRPEYYAPCGVGILREISRAAFQNKPSTFPTLKEALADIGSRLRQPVTKYTEKSWLLNQQRAQTKLTRFF